MLRQKTWLEKGLKNSENGEIKIQEEEYEVDGYHKKS